MRAGRPLAAAPGSRRIYLELAGVGLGDFSGFRGVEATQGGSAPTRDQRYMMVARVAPARVGAARPLASWSEPSRVQVRDLHVPRADTIWQKNEREGQGIEVVIVQPVVIADEPILRPGLNEA